jgi:hypothetical protein
MQYEDLAEKESAGLSGKNSAAHHTGAGGWIEFEAHTGFKSEVLQKKIIKTAHDSGGSI